MSVRVGHAFLVYVKMGMRQRKGTEKGQKESSSGKGRIGRMDSQESRYGEGGGREVRCDFDGFAVEVQDEINFSTLG